ncbi:DUF3365 domain-containing protein [Wenzhouxiangella sp. XN79A]|uniref:Tll0287-like domain-containing protein n=1 Tax=Wenzhouxiangella sp. XN79A TaxID=2724193 RepID=UPI00144AA50A|nr:DUF3365 domain-containing protein [Wenzhouxiangella sp. XN79A]NKI33730.1 DUF3365 domain-containing protein [Wenzhouxiangella sp. XN79A]
MNTVQRIALGAVVLGCSHAALPVAAGEAAPEWVDRARSSAGTLASRLQQELQAAIAEGGPVQGIETCRIRAPEIAEETSSERARVGRTALRVRNPDNAPDAWEAGVLQDFEQRIAAGASPAELETWIETDLDGRATGRWMKAIPTQPLCVTCHGETLAPELAEAIEAAYPADAATGFAPGDLRGAFTVEVVLDAGD